MAAHHPKGKEGVTNRLHKGEVPTDAELVRRLVASQFPHFGDLEVVAFPSTGTVNAIYRLGDDLYVRLPRHRRWVDDLQKELRWLTVLGPQLPFATPEPVAAGDPGCGFPFRWAIYRWLPGDVYTRERIDDETEAAADMASFVSTLRRIEVSDGPPSGRLPLRQLDESTRWALASMSNEIDVVAATAAWDRSLQGAGWEGTPVWRHCDLLPTNLLVRKGRVYAVLDFGGVGVGDPAADVIVAWTMFGESGRLRFREELDVDDETWNRARGYALHQALLIIPYYRDTNPAFVATAKETVREVLRDLET